MPDPVITNESPRDRKRDHIRSLLRVTDRTFAQLKAKVDELIAFRDEVEENAEGLYTPEDLTAVNNALAARRDAIQVWAPGLGN